jgi:hypothetical protein
MGRRLQGGPRGRAIRRADRPLSLRDKLLATASLAWLLRAEVNFNFKNKVCKKVHKYFEIVYIYRHTSIQKSDNDTAILTSTSVKKQTGNKLVGDIRANMFISKYVIEQLIATDTAATFKITHYIKLDYK